MNKIKPVFIFLLITQLTACSSGPFSHLPFGEKQSYTDSLVIDSNAVALYPNNIDIYTLNNLPNKPYKVVDNFKVSVYSQYGSRLQRAKVNTYLQTEAVKLGGDGVIVLGVQGKFVYAEAIKFVPADK